MAPNVGPVLTPLGAATSTHQVWAPVPALAGTEAQALATLSTAGFAPVVIPVRTPGIPGSVFGQDPAAGLPRQVGSHVTVYVVEAAPAAPVDLAARFGQVDAAIGQVQASATALAGSVGAVDTRLGSIAADASAARVGVEGLSSDVSAIRTQVDEVYKAVASVAYGRGKASAS